MNSLSAAYIYPAFKGAASKRLKKAFYVGESGTVAGQALVSI
jgi:hypothetical protein